ncbi:MAG: secretin N-terminal domain-containing protein, partial [Verrucomicrobiota bacterium]
MFIDKKHQWRLRVTTWVTLIPFLLSSTIVPGQTVDPLEDEDSEKLIELKFSGAPLDQILDLYSDLTGRTVIKDPQANATITLRGKTKFTPRETLEALESVLSMNNVGLVALGDKFLKAVPTTNLRKSGAPMNLEASEEPFPDVDRLISQIFSLKHIEIAEVQPVLDSIKHTYGMIQPLERSNSLLITDTAQNLNRMDQLVKFLDQPITIQEDVFVREIVYAAASEIASKLQELIQESQSEAGGKPRLSPSLPTAPKASSSSKKTPAGVIRAPSRTSSSRDKAPAVAAAAELAERGIIQGEVKIVADDRTGLLFIISQPVNFAFFDKIINLLDRPVDPQFVVRVYAMEYAEAADIAGILNDFIGSQQSDTPSGGGGG